MQQKPDFEQSNVEGSAEIEEDLEVIVIGGGDATPVHNGEDLENTGQFNCPSVGIHPAPQCDSFYMCSKVGLGGASLQSCGAGLHFDASIKACNWPVQAKCTHSLVAAKFYTREM